MAGVLRDRGALAITVLGGGEHRHGLVVCNQQRDDFLAAGELHAAHTACHAPHRPHVLLVETHGLAGVGEQHDVLPAFRERNADQVVPLFQIHRDDSGRARARKIGKRRLLDRAVGRGHEYVLVFVELLDRQDRGYLFAVHERQQVDDRFAAAGAPALRHVVDLDPVQSPAIGETQHVVVGIGDEQVVDEIVFLGRRGLLAAAAALLGPVVCERLGLHVACVRQRHHHVLGRNQVLHAQVLGVHHDLAAAFVSELAPGLCKLVGDDPGDALRLGKDVDQVGNVVHDLPVLVGDPLPLQSGQALQLHFQDALCLHFGEAVAVGLQTIIASQSFRAGSGDLDACQHVLHQLRAPNA